MSHTTCGVSYKRVIIMRYIKECVMCYLLPRNLTRDEHITVIEIPTAYGESLYNS